MKEKWKQIESILTDKKALSYLHLNEGATAEQLTSLEKHIGVTLPDSIHEFLM